MPDLATLDRIYHRTGDAHDGTMAKAGQDCPVRAILFEAFSGQCCFDHRCEVAIVNVDNAGPANGPTREQPVYIAVSRPHETIGGHQDSSREGVEFSLLHLPRAAVVTHQVLVLLKAGVSIRWEHLAMGVDVDPLPHSLLKQLFEILQVVA